jgi:predicted flap endonuclease-1-like 5' DNA nuclease
LTRIKGIGPAVADRLVEMDVYDVRGLADLTVDEAMERGRVVGLRDRTRWERWIEEARQICGKQRTTG